METPWHGDAASPASMRGFGDAADLNLDLTGPDRPTLVTTLLAQCGDRQDPAFWWSQQVGVRTAALVRLFALTEQREVVSLTASCSASACGEVFEFDLPLRSLPAGTVDAGPIGVRLDGDRAVTLRLPTGEDLRQWSAARPVSRAEAVRLMLDSLVVAGQAEPDDEPVVSASIAATDPLVALTVACRCPACDAPNEVAVDLETLVLRRLEARQRALLREVHRLASHYGWTESEVLAVPPSRRAGYLALIEDEG